MSSHKPVYEELLEALRRVRLRLHFMGWPAESYWNVGTEKPMWIPDWRYEAQLIDHALYGSTIDTPEKPTDTKPYHEIKQHLLEVRAGRLIWNDQHPLGSCKWEDIPPGTKLYTHDAPVRLYTSDAVEAAALYGWQHHSWDWAAVKIGLERFQGATLPSTPIPEEYPREPAAFQDVIVGRLPTLSQEEYPGLPEWWVQLRTGSAHDTILARVYGDTPQAAHEHAHAVANALRATQPDDDWHLRGYAYASKQATNCAQCGEYKHTPLRIDAMGGYVCLTCIDKKLGSLLGEFGYPTEHGVDGSPERATKESLVPCDCGCGRSCCAFCGNDLGFIAKQQETCNNGEG